MSRKVILVFILLFFISITTNRVFSIENSKNTQVVKFANKQMRKLIIASWDLKGIYVRIPGVSAPVNSKTIFFEWDLIDPEWKENFLRKASIIATKKASSTNLKLFRALKGVKLYLKNGLTITGLEEKSNSSREKIAIRFKGNLEFVERANIKRMESVKIPGHLIYSEPEIYKFIINSVKTINKNSHLKISDLCQKFSLDKLADFHKQLFIMNKFSLNYSYSQFLNNFFQFADALRNENPFIFETLMYAFYNSINNDKIELLEIAFQEVYKKAEKESTLQQKIAQLQVYLNLYKSTRQEVKITYEICTLLFQRIFDLALNRVISFDEAIRVITEANLLVEIVAKLKETKYKNLQIEQLLSIWEERDFGIIQKRVIRIPVIRIQERRKYQDMWQKAGLPLRVAVLLAFAINKYFKIVNTTDVKCDNSARCFGQKFESIISFQ